jgi:sugar-specific transcriptional regulator TrmB
VKRSRNSTVAGSSDRANRAPTTRIEKGAIETAAIEATPIEATARIEATPIEATVRIEATPIEATVRIEATPIETPRNGSETVDETDAVEAFERLGLTSYEAKVFIALQQLGSGTAREVHRIADVPRSQVYSAAESLEERGLVDVQQSNPIQYRPVSVDAASETLRDRFERERDRAVEYLETVRSDRAETEEQEDIWTIRGSDHVTDRIVELVRDATHRVYFGTGSSVLVDERVVRALRERAEAGVDVTVTTDAAVVRGRFDDVDEVVLEQPAGEVADDDHAGRVLLVDGDSLLLSVIGDETLPDVTDETAIWSAHTNFAAVLIRLIETSVTTIDVGGDGDGTGDD